MNMHQNARLTPKGRELLIQRLERGKHPEDVAGASHETMAWHEITRL
ncbi:MAG: leucine zipper domain-containing protein, partial [Alphaproteobacteria bacterium]